MANRKYEIPEEDVNMVAEPAANYGITIPVTVPTMGGYTLEALRHELTEFARNLVFAKNDTTTSVQRPSWRTMPISDKIKKMSLGKSDISTDNRTVKQLLEELVTFKSLR